MNQKNNLICHNFNAHIEFIDKISSEILDKIIIEKISELSDIKVSDIKNDSLLNEDLGFDILDLAELSMHLEDKFKIDIDNIFYKVKTVGDLILYIKNLTKHNK